MAKKEQLRKKFNDYYQCNSENLCKALGITIKELKEYAIIRELTFDERIQLAQLKTLLEIKEILIDNIIEKATKWHRVE